MFRHLIPFLALAASAAEPVDFTVKLETVMKHDDGKFLWFHPRAAAIPGGVVMTIQKHLMVSDYYSGLHFMRRKGVDGAWTGPVLPPGWHEPTQRLLVIGCQVRYSDKGKQLDDVKRSHQTVYAIFDPKT